MKRGFTLAGALLGAASLLAACGTPTSSGSTNTTAASGSGSSNNTAWLAKYQSAVTAAQAPVTWDGPTTKAVAPKNKFIVVVTCTEALEGCKLLTQGSVDAANALGWRNSVINVQDPTGYDQAVQTAITEGANGIVLVGVDQSLIPQGLAMAHQKHIPVVSIFQYNTPSPTGVNVEVSPSATAEGKALADAMIANTKGNVNVLFLNDAEFSLPVHMLAAAKAELAACTQCKVTYASPINFTAAVVNTNLPGEVVSAVRSDPSINSIIVGFDPPATFVIPALDQAGLKGKVKMYSQLGTTSALSFIAQNNIMTADMGASNEWGGWAGMDEMVRLLNGQPIVNENVPVLMLTASNLPPSGKPFTGDYAGFQAKYKALWGLS